MSFIKSKYKNKYRKPEFTLCYKTNKIKITTKYHETLSQDIGQQASKSTAPWQTGNKWSEP